MSARRDTLRALAGCTGYVAAAAPAVDEALAHAALTEQVAPLLGARMVDGRLAATPGAAAMLRRAHLATKATEIFASAAHVPVFAALRARRVPFLVLKGGALIRTGVFDGPGRRLMADLDVLVPHSDWAAAHTALAAAGATASADEVLLARLQLNHERTFRTAAGVVVDVHRRLTGWPLFDVDHAGLFARARTTTDGILIPCEEDLFLSLAIHAAQDGFALPLRSLVDGLALGARAALDHGALFVRATAWRARRALARWLHMLLALGLSPPDRWAALANRLDAHAGAGAELPEPVPADVATAAAARWRARWQLLRAADGPSRPLVFFAYRATLRAGDVVAARLAR